MHARFRRAALGALKHTGISSVSGRLTIATRMYAHTDDRSPREAFQRDPLFECFPRALHLNDPNERLTLFIAHQSVPFFIQRNEVKLEVGGIGNYANDHARKYSVHTPVIHR